MEAAHLVGTGGAIGAILRYFVGQLLVSDRFPKATFAVNVIGTFVLGLLIFAGADNDMLLLIGVGACGAFTTFSSFSVETVELWDDGARVQAVVYASLTFFTCVLGVGLAAALVFAVGAVW